MSLVPPNLSVVVTTNKRACILDASLALSKFGLLLAKRLGEEFNLWFVRELWHILDNTHLYRLKPEMLAPKFANSHGTDFLPALDGLSLWEKARYEKNLGGLKIYWLSDQVGDSLIPEGVDQGLFVRFEALARSLEKMSPDQGNVRHADHDIFSPCFRDAAALTVALSPYRSFILTLHRRRNRSKSRESDHDEPFICSYLRANGINCHQVDSASKTRLEREYIAPIFARNGISELMWAGMRLAAVHILAPEASVMPLSIKDDENDSGNDPLLNEEKTSEKNDWWKGAVGFWYSLWPG